MLKTRKSKGMFSWCKDNWEYSDAKVRLWVLKINFSRFFSLSGNFSYVLTSILFSFFIVCLVQLCLLMLFRAFFSWEECGINWQWWLHWKHNSWPLCHYCFCNCSSTVTACQLFWWHSFALSMHADLSLCILARSCPCALLHLGRS